MDELDFPDTYNLPEDYNDEDFGLESGSITFDSSSEDIQNAINELLKLTEEKTKSSTLKRKQDSCRHIWKKTIGLYNVWEDCTTCLLKKEDLQK